MSLFEIYVVLMAPNEYWFAFGISIGSIGFGERELNSDSEKLRAIMKAHPITKKNNIYFQIDHYVMMNHICSILIKRWKFAATLKCCV